MVFKELVWVGILELFNCMIIKYKLDLEKKIEFRLIKQ